MENDSALVSYENPRVANIAGPSTSSEINFEDFIKVVNVAQKTNGSDEIIEEDDTEFIHDEEDKSTTNDIAKPNLQKIAPKPAVASTSGKSGHPGQVVIIQGPGGTPQPIRLTGVNPNSAQGKAPVKIQVLKMQDGNLLQLKNNKQLNLSNLGQVNIGSKKIPQVVLASHSKLAGATNRASGQPILKTLTTAEAQKAGLIKVKPSEAGSKQLPKILPAVVSSSSGTSATGTSSTAKQNRFILPDSKGVVLKSDNEMGSKQIIVPQTLKLSPNTAGSLQAIQIPGKSGIQYVRLLGTAVPSSGSKATVTSVKASEVAATKVSIAGTSTMSAVPGPSGQRYIVTNSENMQNSNTIGANKNENASATVTAGKQNIKELLALPKLRKIAAPPTGKVIVVKKDSEGRITQLNPATKYKMNTIGTHKVIKRLNSSPSETQNSQERPNIKSQYVMIPQEILKEIKTEPIGEEDYEQDAEGAQRKLYSVLKPSMEQQEVQHVRRKSPPLEDLRRKHCNCTKSQCLKLYCDCFANGEFCQDCNCKECFNNLDNEQERQKAIRICLERNPNAFKPKISKARDQSDIRLHSKGCNCKRSGCLKNYCECYEAKITCSSNCKCFGCRNVEDRPDTDPFDPDTSHNSLNRSMSMKRQHEDEKTATPAVPVKQPYNFITPDVVDATVQCMLAQAEECKRSGIPPVNSAKMILEELGRCLVEIIDFSIRNMDN